MASSLCSILFSYLLCSTRGVLLTTADNRGLTKAERTKNQWVMWLQHLLLNHQL